MVEGQVKEQRLARDGLESRREVHEVGLLGDEGRVQAEGLKPFNQRLEGRSEHQPEGHGGYLKPKLGPLQEQQVLLILSHLSSPVSFISYRHRVTWRDLSPLP